jgi:hypothetical protein
MASVSAFALTAVLHLRLKVVANEATRSFWAVMVLCPWSLDKDTCRSIAENLVRVQIIDLFSEFGRTVTWAAGIPIPVLGHIRSCKEVDSSRGSKTCCGGRYGQVRRYKERRECGDF